MTTKPDSHVSLRSQERMSRSIDHFDLVCMRDRILNDKDAWFLKWGVVKDGHPTEKWIVKYDSRYWMVIFRRSIKAIVTVLGPPDSRQMFVTFTPPEERNARMFTDRSYERHLSRMGHR